MFRFDGTVIHIAADYNLQPEGEEYFRRAFPSPLTSDGLLSAAIRERRVVQHDHAQTNPAVPAESRELARRLGYQAVMAVPMLHDDTVIGAIAVSRVEPHPFSEQQIDLVKTFADQAVRLFNETKEALEQQTATADILRVISSSPTDVGPVLERMAESAARFCQAQDVSIWRVEGGRVQLVAHHGPIASFPIGRDVSLTPGGVAARTILECRPVQRG